jgi:hypothetical protein
MEIKSVSSVAIDLYVLDIWAEGLEGASHLERDLGLVGAHEHLYLVGTGTQQSHVLGLNVLEVNQNEMGCQTVPFAQTANREF